MSVPPPMLLQRADRHHYLPVEDAWAIALTWQTQLQDKVLLEAAGDTVHKSYEWIHIELTSTCLTTSTNRQVSAARAAALTWFALSCCPGYSGRENPVFWKCVFSAMAQRHVVRVIDIDGQSVTDAYGFFDRDGVEFPRFRLSAYPPDSRYVRLFFGLSGMQPLPEDTIKLEQIMGQLEPWVDHSRIVRYPVVTVRLRRPPLDVDWVLAAFEKLLTDANHHRSTMPTWPVQTFSIDALDIEIHLSSKYQSQMQHMLQRLNQHDLEITRLKLFGSIPIDRDVLAEIVGCVLPPLGSSDAICTKTTSLDLSKLGDTLLSPFVSSLPYSTSVRSVELSYWNRNNEADEREMAWIAYALFHPDTPSSTWKSLTLSQTAFTEDRVAMLRAMARGNNLAAFLHGGDEAATSDGYYRATLALDVSIYDQPVTSLWKRFKAVRLLTTSDATTTVEVCGVSTDDPTQWDEWVPVVLPAYGLVWARAADVTHVERREPSKSALTALCLDAAAARSIGGRDLNTVFQLLGHRLVHLEMSWLSFMVSADSLRQLLTNCPSLESLAIPYHTALCDATIISLLPRLRELCLRYEDQETDGTSAATPISLPHLPRSLQVLRIDARGKHDSFALQYYELFHHVLSRRSHLRVFHWQEGLHESYHPTPYAETCAETERRLDKLGVPHRRRHVVLSRLPAPCAAAFLNTVQAQRLDPQVAKIIVAFAGTRAARSIVLEPPEHAIPHNRRGLFTSYSYS